MIEEWRNIEGFTDYKISNDGFVKSFKNNKCKILKVSYNNGYRLVNLYKDKKRHTYKVSRLVAKAFPEICGEWFDGCTIDHINTIRDDDRAENIKVCTQKTNINNPLTKAKQTKYHTKEEKRIALCNNAKRWKKNHPEYAEKTKEHRAEYLKNWRKNHPDYHHQYYIKKKSTARQTLT